ncbi:TPA: glycosyltransferase [Clostridium perfringens]
MKKICIIAPVHCYDDIRVFHKEAKSLVKYGYRVTIFAKAKHDFTQDNIRIKSLHYKNRIERFLLIPGLVVKALKENADLYHIHNPETIVVGGVLKLLNKRVIYDCHENFIDKIDSREWINNNLKFIFKKVVYYLEKVAGKIFDGVIVTQDDVKDRIGIKSVKIENPPIVGMLDKVKYENIEYNKEIKVCYIGSITEDRGIINVIKAIDIINKECSCKLNLAGPCEKLLMDKMKEIPGFKYVDYYGVLGQIEAFNLLANSNIGIITILDRGGYSRTNPNKLFEYMMFGKPFVASDFEEWKKAIHNKKAGLFVNPNNIEEIAEKIKKIYYEKELYYEMSNEGKNFIKKEYNWEIEEKKLIALYKKILRLE